MANKKRGLRRLINATKYTMDGFISAWKNEEAFRQETILLMIMLPIGLWLGQTATQKILLTGSCIIVIIVELINSAIEAVVDRIGSEHHELSGRAKDMASAAVFLSLIFVLVTWGIIIYYRFI